MQAQITAEREKRSHRTRGQAAGHQPGERRAAATPSRRARSKSEINVAQVTQRRLAIAEANAWRSGRSP
jgi:hypothetical protein